MSKLTPVQIEEYFAIHLPYRTRNLLASFEMGTSFSDPRLEWQVRFETSLITGRMYLQVLGLTKKCGVLAPFIGRDPDDVTAADLGANPVPIGDVSAADAGLFFRFIVMADKSAAHLTMPRDHPVQERRLAITRICVYLNKYIYEPTGRRCPYLKAFLDASEKYGPAGITVF